MLIKIHVSMLSSGSISFEDITDAVDNLVDYINKKGRLTLIG